MNLIKSVIQHSSKYLTGSVVASGTTLLMMKYYTFAFTPEEFGILSLYLVVFRYFTTLCSLDVQSSVSRLYFDYDSELKKEYLSTIFWFLSFVCLGVVFLGVVFSSFLSDLIYLNTQEMFILTIFASVFSVFLTLFTRVLYNEQLSKTVLKQSLFQTVVNHGASVFFIAVSQMGILGRLLGQSLASLLSAVFSYSYLKNKEIICIRRVFHKSMLKETLKLSFPTLLLAIQSMVFLYIDRFLIKFYLGESSVGIYSFAFMLGQGLAIIYEAVYQAILPDVYKDMKDNYSNAIEKIGHFYKKYFAFSLLLTLFMSYFSDFLLVVISNESYYGASDVIPYIMFGFMMGGLYKLPALIINFHKKVWLYPWASILSLIANISLNISLIPKIGIIGAAFTSFIGLFLYSLVLQVYSFKYLCKKDCLYIILSYVFVFFIVAVYFMVNYRAI